MLNMFTKFALPFFFSLVSFLFGTSSAAFLAPVTQDFSTKKYTISVYLNNPPHPINLLLDLGATTTVLDCSSSTHQINSLYLHITDGRNPGQLGLIPEFVFTCTKKFVLKGLVKGASGLAGLGRSRMSLPAQVSNVSSENQIFALCLSGSPSAPGVAFFATAGPYYFLPEIDLSKSLIYTPLLQNLGKKISRRGKNLVPSNEYFIGLTSIKVNGKDIDFDKKLLSIDEKGFGGTKLSTITPYTVLHTKIFKALTEVFLNESAALNLTVTNPMKPFRICYDANDVLSTQVGPAFPTIDLVMPGKNSDDDVIWRIFGSNSMVRIIRDDVDVWCLGFIDGGRKRKTSIVMGGHQMEDNLLQFDLESKKFGFSSSVLVYGTMCANFNFTSIV